MQFGVNITSTVQFGANINVIAGFVGGTVGIGIAIDDQGNIGFYGYVGGGAAFGAGAALSGEVLSSNGTTIRDLAGVFNDVIYGGGWGPYGAGESFWGPGEDGQTVIGGGMNCGPGVGGGAFAGETDTTVAPVGDLWDGSWKDGSWFGF